SYRTSTRNATRLRHCSKLDRVTKRGGGRTQCSGRQLQNRGAFPKQSSHSERPKSVAQANDLPISVHHRDVNRELHTPGVHTLRRHDQKPITLLQLTLSQEANN